MLIRALIVLLLVLNLGVAAWWHWSTPTALEASTDTPANVARLQLLRERDAGDRPEGGRVSEAAAAPVVPAKGEDGVAASPPAEVAAATEPDGNPPRCYRFGPFDSEDTLVAAQATLKPLTQALVVQRAPVRAGRGWRVYLPALPSADEATSTAGRIAAAGFRDYFIVREGDEANSIALGRFGTEAAARRHADALNALGFAARAEPLGAGSGPAWVDVRAAAGFDPVAALAQVGVGQQRGMDCAGVR